MRKEFQQVGAPYAGVVESARLGKTVGQVTAGASIAFRAGAATGRQFHPLENGLLVHGLGVQYLRKIGREDIEVNPGHPFGTDPQIVQALHVTVAFHEYISRRLVAQSFNLASASHDQPRHIP